MILGTDLSVYTRSINYQRMFDAGVRFAINKLGQGGYSVDALAITHRDGCKSAGVYQSWYYFADYRYSAGPQAQKHVELMNGAYGWGELNAWIDLEYEERLGWGRPAGYNMHAWLVAYRNRFKMIARGKVLGLYTNPDLIHAMRPYLTADDLEMPLWIAHWNQEPPDIEPWLKADFHQTIGDVPADWATGGVDYDDFDGTEDDLREYAGGGHYLSLEEKVDILWQAHEWLQP